MSRLMKKIFPLIICISFSIYCLPLESSTDTLMYNECMKDDYSFELSDVNQKKVAIGMVAWGIFMAAATLLLAGLIPDSTDPDATTGTPSTSGNLFSSN